MRSKRRSRDSADRPHNRPAVEVVARVRDNRFITIVATCVTATLASLAYSNATAQSAPPLPTAAAPAQQTEPIYWKQQLFLIPYQWSSAAGPAGAQIVTLYVSKDRGASWQKISDARPEVKAFNYRAEGDAEYWFAIRTLDRQGQLWPAGDFQPELRVIVDTTIPRIEQLLARPTPNGMLDVQCRASDANLDPASLKLDAQFDTTAPWQPIAWQAAGNIEQATGAASPAASATAGNLIHVVWQPTAGLRPLAIRATMFDRAGNSTVYQTPVDTTPLIVGPALSQPTVGAMPTAVAAPVGGAASVMPPQSASAPGPGWVSSSAAAAPAAAVPTSQAWPASGAASAPFRLWTGGPAAHDDGLTAYGNPLASSAAPTVSIGTVPVGSAASPADNRVAAQYADATKPGEPGLAPAPNHPATGGQFVLLEPFRQSSTPAASAASAAPALVPVGQLGASPNSNRSAGATSFDTLPPTNRPTAPPKLVGSRTFALEYDVDDTTQAGVARVELWGTRDGGHSWYRAAVDDDSRSPLVVTVDDDGLYGFKIIVQSAAGGAIEPPRVGEAPELWVSVDLNRPVIELTSIERGEGNLSDHLILRWRAQDNNLEPRPISLFFSSRPTGPWSAIAANLEDTGSYAWRVERFVPERIFLRAEARDAAGNLAAFQTRDAIEVNAVQMTGRLREAAR